MDESLPTKFKVGRSFKHYITQQSIKQQNMLTYFVQEQYGSCIKAPGNEWIQYSTRLNIPWNLAGMHRCRNWFHRCKFLHWDKDLMHNHWYWLRIALHRILVDSCSDMILGGSCMYHHWDMIGSAKGFMKIIKVKSETYSISQITRLSDKKKFLKNVFVLHHNP